MRAFARTKRRSIAVYKWLLCHVPALGMVLSSLEGRRAELMMLFSSMW